MLAIHPGTMFSGTTQPESARVHHHYERRLSHSSQQLQVYSHTPRHSAELPRPLEPRPTHHLQSSLSEASTHQRHDPYRGTRIAPPDSRPRGQNLPGLRDILTPTPQGSAPTTYSSTWTPTSSAPSSHQSGEGYYSHAGLHPPLALYPPSDPSPAYQPHPSRRLELPILETSPVGRQLPQSLPVSPYTGYPETRGYAEGPTERTRQASTTSYLTNGVHSPYTPGSEDTSYRISGPPYERGPPTGPLSATGPESQRKYLGVKELPGEGTFHLYEGGYRIPTHVDGEHVNPAWGLTKANKPRKRLALACLDCREKKIKCEPGVNSCLQCEKAKRHCRRAPALLPQNENAGPPVWQQSNAGTPVRKGASDPTPQPNRDPDIDLANKRRTREDTSPPNIPSKKQRSASPIVSTPDLPNTQNGNPTTAGPGSMPYPAADSGRNLILDEDPFAVDPEMTLHLLGLYFTHLNDATYALFPRHTFLRWVRNKTSTCQSERVVLYALIAVGSIFADDRYTGFGTRCAQIAADAAVQNVGQLSLSAVQTRLLLALYHLAKGNNDAAWDYAGWAIRACTSTKLRLHIDTDCEDEEEPAAAGEVEFSFSRTQRAECQRRTFWCVFMLDRFLDGTLCGIDVRDLFLRLPSSDESYEHGLRSDAPFYNNGIIDSVKTILTPSSQICPMAWLALITAIWGDVLNFTNRTVYRGQSAYREAYERFYADTHTSLQGWLSRLPEPLHYNETNIDRSIQGGYAGVFISMHALYHFILIRTNRYVRHGFMPDIISRNIRAAHYHAHSLLSMMIALQAPRRDSASHGVNQRPDFVLTTPFVGQAIVSAIDVVGAGGHDTNFGTTLEAINGGIGCLHELSRFWSGAENQCREAKKRCYQIKNILTRPYKAHSGAWLGREWGVKDRMEQEFKVEHDCIYADDGGGDGYSRTYYKALQENAHDGRGAAPGTLRIA